jgi:HEAT repeat protein
MPGLFDKLLGKDIATRVQNIQYLGNLDSESSIPKLIKALSDEAVVIRRAASSALEQHYRTGDRNAIVALINVLNDPDTEVRKNAALGLSEFTTKSQDAELCASAKKELIKLLEKENDESVMKSIVVGLAIIQDTALTGPMIEAFRPKGKKTVAMAIDAINDLPSTEIRLEMKKALRTIL